jgi:hypothetical protein
MENSTSVRHLLGNTHTQADMTLTAVTLVPTRGANRTITVQLTTATQNFAPFER